LHAQLIKADMNHLKMQNHLFVQDCSISVMHCHAATLDVVSL
jgi:hypothetical protein